MTEHLVKVVRRTCERVSRYYAHRLRDWQDVERVGKLSEEERRRLLDVFDTMLPKIPARPAVETDAELKEIRAGRRRGGRRHPVE